MKQFIPHAKVYLFCSRAKDHLKGGDIDLLVLGSRELTGQEKRDIKIGFYTTFGERKVGIISFKKDDPARLNSLP